MSIRLLTGDCCEVLATLPDASVHMVCTSPPYYGLRDYGVAGQLGLEATPDAYLATMVQVFRDVKRVLRDDGTCWVNIGDSYATQPAGNKEPSDAKRGPGSYRRSNIALDTTRIAKPKDLLMMPARLALALQADGWWIRSDIIWAKPNPMPESCGDRPTSAHEHVFLLSKRKTYYYDADAVKEPQSDNTHTRGTKWRNGDMPKIAEAGSGIKNNRSFQAVMADLPDGVGRNLRNVWSIPTHAYPDAHFATFPPALVERCIRAGTSERGCCAACGAPWVRVTEDGGLTASTSHNYAPAPNKGLLGAAGNRAANMTRDGFTPNRNRITITTGWQPSCKCDADVVPCTVLDPFVGSGTTALVADRLQRHAIGIDLNTDYARMAVERITQDCPLFVELPPAEDPEDARMADLFSYAAD